MKKSTTITLLILVVAITVDLDRPRADEAPPIEAFLTEGQLAEGAAAMQRVIESNPDNHHARFSLGMVQFFQAIEGLGQDQYRYGLLGGRARAIPFMRLPIPENPEPEQISYEKARALLQRLIDQLKTTEQTLAAVKPEGIRIPLKLGLVRLDLNNDGEFLDQETIWHISQVLQNPRLRDADAAPKDFQIVFDDGDVLWLQGYCHVLSAAGEIILAHDWHDQFERSAHLFFPNVDTPYEFLQEEGTGQFMSFGAQNIFDFIAWLHTINYEVVEPERMQKALTHMETVIRLSRESWKLINLEEDDDREWVPNARQKSVLRGLNVGQNVVEGWQDFLDEVELILQGKKLVPFWRGVKGGISPFVGRPQFNKEIGINVRKIFTEPTRFDLALWLQGTGLKPYLEKGEISSPEVWQHIIAQFNGRFFNFALWFN